MVKLVKRAFGKDPVPAAILWSVLFNTWAGLMAYPAAQRLAAQRVAAVRGG